jgi:hypothetical protein
LQQWYRCNMLHLMNESLSLRLGDKLARALNEEARETGLPKGEIVRQALEARLQAAGKLPVMRRYFGLIRGPSDLSTNKAYRRKWNQRPS